MNLWRLYTSMNLFPSAFSKYHHYNGENRENYQNENLFCCYLSNQLVLTFTSRMKLKWRPNTWIGVATEDASSLQVYRSENVEILTETWKSSNVIEFVCVVPNEISHFFINILWISLFLEGLCWRMKRSSCARDENCAKHNKRQWNRIAKKRTAKYSGYISHWMAIYNVTIQFHLFSYE